jgi:Fe-S cluster assembly ATP-binding protein
MSNVKLQMSNQCQNLNFKLRTKSLTIKDLRVKIDDQEILKGVSLVLKAGEIHTIMGPNGSGKSTLAKVLIGLPKYRVVQGQAQLGRQDLLKMSPEQRARKGLFLAFQYPVEVPGVNVFEFLRAISPKKISMEQFETTVGSILKQLNINEKFLERNLHEGFSGGEKKKLEILQMAILQPKIIILDEIDSGLDIDAMRLISKAIKKFRPADSAVLIITHHQRILKYIKPDFVHVMIDGRIVASGSQELAKKVEKEGYKGFNVKCQMPARLASSQGEAGGSNVKSTF